VSQVLRDYLARPGGPYIVTTKRQGRREAGWSGWTPWEVLSRRAVATLDDARDEVERRWTATLPWAQEGIRGRIDLKITESGGTVTLPDGTIIEVEATTWQWLAARTDLFDRQSVARYAGQGDTNVQRRILDAYNARQGSS
jgi:hypothetical protein